MASKASLHSVIPFIADPGLLLALNFATRSPQRLVAIHYCRSHVKRRLGKARLHSLRILANGILHLRRERSPMLNELERELLSFLHASGALIEAAPENFGRT